MYQLIALDMDGTLLGTDKKILLADQRAVEKAVQAGKIVVLDTGRCLAEPGSREKALLHLLLEKSIVQRSHWAHMEQFGMGVYQEMYARVAEKWVDLIASMRVRLSRQQR